MKSYAVSLALIVLLPGLVAAQIGPRDYSPLYEQASPAIVTVVTDTGSGSGFLVTPFGHIATNFHVVRNSRYLAVQFTDGRKVTAEIVATYESGDMALIKVNSSVVDGIRPLPIIPEDKDATIRVGIPVVAIGSPEIQDFVMTQGILSKASDMTLLGDFVLQPGNSGGPLMNTDGEVIGMNTFIDGTIGGAIRIGPLRDLVNSPQLFLTTIVEPSPDVLPAVRARYPVQILNEKIVTEELNWDAYRFAAGNFAVTAITPVLIGKIQVMQDRMRAANQFMRRRKNVEEAGFRGLEQPFYSWYENAGPSLAFAVRFDIEPRTGLTGKSKWSNVLSRVFLFGKSTTLDMEFKGEFQDFRLFRDGELVQPIIPGRHLVAGASEGRRFVDQAYGGTYTYDPAEFMTGNMFRIEIVDAGDPNIIHKSLTFDASSPLIRQIRSDFTYYPAVVAVDEPIH